MRFTFLLLHRVEIYVITDLTPGIRSHAPLKRLKRFGYEKLKINSLHRFDIRDTKTTKHIQVKSGALFSDEIGPFTHVLCAQLSTAISTARTALFLSVWKALGHALIGWGKVKPPVHEERFCTFVAVMYPWKRGKPNLFQALQSKQQEVTHPYA
ncbi:hypothetical protein J6590_008153 [Homalodisca vitripennis]|nr:hypothetical protein J6590_008153 [Homalodisca vitripennis]